MAGHVSQAANRLIDAEAVAGILASRWPSGTTTDPTILRAEIRMILGQHARKGVLGPALTEVYRAGWKAGEVAAEDAVVRVKPSVPPTVAVPLHHRPTPQFKTAKPDDSGRKRELRDLDRLMREAPGAPRGGRSIF
jgi:hypothetical protein